MKHAIDLLRDEIGPRVEERGPSADAKLSPAQGFDEIYYRRSHHLNGVTTTTLNEKKFERVLSVRWPEGELQPVRCERT